MASATPLHPSVKESLNYAQLCCLLVEVGSLVLREIFDRLCPPGNLMLHLNAYMPTKINKNCEKLCYFHSLYFILGLL